MTTVNDILKYIESFAPCDTAMDFDNCGLLVGDGGTEVNGVLVTLDITAEVVKEARELGCGLIVSHHPVIFQPIKKLGSCSVPYLLAQYGIAAICMHTNLDLAQPFGVNTCLGEAIGVRGVKRADAGECLFIGELENAEDSDVFARRVMDALGCEGLRYTRGSGTVKKVALASGSGGSDIFDAAALGADALVTGEIKHHEINAANELGVCVVDAGHFKSEDIVILPLTKRLEGQFSAIKFTKSQVYGDKMKYICR